MKACLFAAAAVLSAFGLMSFASYAPTMPGYGVDDLSGAYAFTFEGNAFAGPILGEIRGVGRIEMDGAGNITSATRTVNVGGMAFQGETATGSYVVHPDGTGSMTFIPDDPMQPPATSDIVLIGKNRVVFVNTDPGFTVSGEAVKQKR